MIGMGHRRIRHLATRKENRVAREDVRRKMGRGGNPILKISTCEWTDGKTRLPLAALIV